MALGDQPAVPHAVDEGTCTIGPKGEVLRDKKPPSIVVGVDSSDASRDALSLALREAEVRGGRVQVVTAWEPPDRGTAGQ
jgi:hypothetical protein